MGLPNNVIERRERIHHGDGTEWLLVDVPAPSEMLASNVGPEKSPVLASLYAQYAEFAFEA